MIGPNHSSIDRRRTKRSASKPPRGVFAVERRRYPRYTIEFPLTYSVVEGKPGSNHWGLATDASKGGILVYINERIKIGTILKIEMFYAEKPPLKKITATAKVAWSDLAARISFGERRYGLQLESIPRGDLNRLRSLLRKCRNSEEIIGTSSKKNIS